MPNTNIENQSPYDVNDAWPKAEPTNARDCLEQLVDLKYSGRAIGCHGAYQNWGCIYSSLDLRIKNLNICAEQCLKEETRLLESFVKEADPHFSPGARQHIEAAELKWKTLRTTGTVFVGRHYGLPTRCIDWTHDPLVAMFFACRRDFNEPGVVWWMDSYEFSLRLAEQWPILYGKDGAVEDDFELDFTKGSERKVLIRLSYPDWMERPKKQKAWITMAGQYDIRHDEEIHRLWVRKCGRLVIGPTMKRELLNMLNQWGVNGESLGVGDWCVETVAADVAPNGNKSPKN